jgi:hypothetical protein
VRAVFAFIVIDENYQEQAEQVEEEIDFSVFIIIFPKLLLQRS